MIDDAIAVEGEATEQWGPEPIGFRVRDRDVDAAGVREVLGLPLGSKGVVITRESVEEGDIGPTVRVFEACSADGEAVRANLGRVVLAVEGYDDDRRELWQIPEARRFFAALWQAAPHLLFFLMPEGPGGQIGSAMFQAMMLHPTGGPATTIADGKWHRRFEGTWVVDGFLEPAFAAMNAFAMRHGIGPSDPALNAMIGRLNKQLRADLIIATLQ